VRLAGEGAAPARTLRFRVRTPATGLALEAPWQDAWDARELLAVRVRVTDAAGLPWPDSLAVRVHVARGLGVLPRDTLVRTRSGVGWAYLHTRNVRARLPLLLQASARGGTGRSGRPLLATLAVARDSGASVRTCIVRRMPAGDPLVDAPGTLGAHPALEWLNRDGVAAFPGEVPGTRSPRLPGFRAWGADSVWPPRYVEIAGGALAGRRIVLDPEGGGDDAAGAGPSGTRAATLNLDVTRALAGMLEAAGAEVRLTRTGDAAVSEVERVQVAEGFRAERYLRVGHAAAPPVAGHYFASGAGRRWAHAVADAFRELGLADSLRVGEVAKYALTQTSATALYVSAGRVDSAASEARLLEPGARRAEAYALFLALAREFAPDAAWPPDSLVVRDAGGLPLPGAPVTLGGALVLQSGPGGTVRFARTEPGPIEVRIDDPRAADPVRLLDLGRVRESAEPH
jgi:N-acetylmuramoyl-L-alanine amidase